MRHMLEQLARHRMFGTSSEQSANQGKRRGLPRFGKRLAPRKHHALEARTFRAAVKSVVTGSIIWASAQGLGSRSIVDEQIVKLK